MYEIVVGRSASDRKRLGLRGTVFLGKHYVSMGSTTSLSTEIYMDVSRSHVVLVSGKRGSGKCLHGDTLITLSDGSVRPIKDLEHDTSEILSLDDSLKIKKMKKSEFFKRKVQRLVSLRLRSGKEIKLTPEHPLLTIKGWQPVEDLRLGSRIATPRRQDVFGADSLNEHFVKLLAYLIAEGHCRTSWVLFSNSDPVIFADFKEAIRCFDPELAVRFHSDSHTYRVVNKDNRYSFRENKVKSWLKSFNLYGLYAPEKFIPQEIFRLPKNQLSLFLNRLFSCDGSIYQTNGHWEIDYGSSSKAIASTVHHLLLRFGILSRLRSKKVKYKGKYRDTYIVLVGSESREKFIEEIGFYGAKKQKAQRCLADLAKIASNSNIDTIPKGIWDLYRPANWAAVGRAMGYAHPKAMRERIRYAPHRQTLLQIALADNQPAIAQLAQSDIFWDEIVSLEYLDGEFEVYDFCVPETHNFVANDIIVHNSYTLAAIAEEISSLDAEIKEKIAVLIFDTMGVFWTMKYPNVKQEDLLDEWGLRAQGLDVTLYTPAGAFTSQKEAGIPVDAPFTILPSELSSSDWCGVFGVTLFSDLGIALDRVVRSVSSRKDVYDLSDLLAAVRADTRLTASLRLACENRFSAAASWGIFSVDATPLVEIVAGGKVSILDVSCYADWNIKSLVVGLLTRKLMQQRMAHRKVEELDDVQRGHSYFSSQMGAVGSQMPLVWLLVDEAHEFLPKDAVTPATDALVQGLREGRQPGVSLVLATQQPGEIHTDVITQTDIVLSHRLTSKRDIAALNAMMHSYLPGQIQKYFDMLPRMKGAALVLDDTAEKMYPLQIHPRKTWHGADAPVAVKAKGSAFEKLGL